MKPTEIADKVRVAQSNGKIPSNKTVATGFMLRQKLVSECFIWA